MKRLVEVRRVIYFFITLSLFLVVFTQPLVAQDPLAELEKTVEGTALETETSIPVIVGRIVSVVLQLMGLILVVLLIAGGFMWMTSGGNEEKIKKAKGLMSSAIVGLIIVLLSYTIANFVIDKLSTTTDVVGS